MAWRVFIDFDGTIAVPDTTDLVLERFADPAWLEVEALWKAGLIGSRECMVRQVGMIRATRAELDAFVETLQVDPGFCAFIADCKARGLEIKVVSDGMDRVVKSVLERIGHGDLPVAANALAYLGGGRWELTSPHAGAGCRSASGTCKCAVAANMGAGFDLLIGVGRSDRCLSEEVDFVFAKDSLVRHCRDNAVPHVAFEGFADLHRPLAALVALPVAAFHRRVAAPAARALDRV